jgi:septal ring factor EnvC (AmiA/AmiB activator)
MTSDAASLEAAAATEALRRTVEELDAEVKAADEYAATLRGQLKGSKAAVADALDELASARLAAAEREAALQHSTVEVSSPSPSHTTPTRGGVIGCMRDDAP